MTDMSWEHAAEARAALNAIVTDPQHGVAALSSAQTMSNLLKDLLPDAPREKSILVAAAEAGLANSLRDHVSQGMDASTAIRLTASSFSATTPFTPEACSWVASEIATAMGISQPSQPGFGGTPSGFDPIGQQGIPTQIGQVPGYIPGPTATPGVPQSPGQGGFNQGGGLDQFGQATAPGAWPSGGGLNQGGIPAGGQAAPGAWQPGAVGYGAAGTGQPGGAGYGPAGTGQPGGAGYGPAGTGQPAPGGWQPGGYGPAGTGQPAQAPGGWQPGGGYGPGGFGPGGVPIKPKGSKRGLFIGGGIVAVLIVVIIIVASLSGGGTPTANGGSSSPPVSSPPVSSPPVSSPPVSAITPLATIMNPAGKTPVGTNCGVARLYGLVASTVTGRIFCDKTTQASVVVWGYQFDNSSDYLAGLAKINHFVGWSATTAASHGCPPPSGSTQGEGTWHSTTNSKYFKHPGQDLECINNGKSLLIWTMPTQQVFFVAQDNDTSATISTIYNKWWIFLDYG